jgi:hypothetical protein
LIGLAPTLLAALLAPQASAPKETPAAAPAEGHITFAEIAKSVGIDCVNLSGDPDKPRIIDTLGGGLCWFDYDNDGWLDLFVPNGSTLDAWLGKTKNAASDHLYRNRGDGTFEDVTDKAGLHDDLWSLSAAAGDFDNDGDRDLYVCNFGLNRLYRNNGDGTFTDIAKEAGVEFDGETPGAAWGDVDLDGDLDLYVSQYIPFDRNRPLPPFAKTMRGMKVMFGPKGLPGAPDRLYRNDGGGKFTDVTKEAGLELKPRDWGHGFTIQILDMTGDDIPDLFVANDMTQNFFFKGLGGGKFRDWRIESGMALDRDGLPNACMGIGIADLNDDQLPDFVVTNFAAEMNNVFVSTEPSRWEDQPEVLENVRRQKPYVKWGIGFFDLDRDGNEDLLYVNGHVFPQVDGEDPRVQKYAEPMMLYRSLGGLKFEEIGQDAGDLKGDRCCRSAAFADYDEDGDVDVAVLQMDLPTLLFRNDTKSAGHYVKVELEGTKCNRDAFGARITVEAGGRRATRWVQSTSSFISQNDPRPFVGLGAVDKVDRITVRWPGGTDEKVEGPLAVDRTYVIRQGSGKVAELAPGKVWPQKGGAAAAVPGAAPGEKGARK